MKTKKEEGKKRKSERERRKGGRDREGRGERGERIKIRVAAAGKRENNSETI